MDHPFVLEQYALWGLPHWATSPHHWLNGDQAQGKVVRAGALDDGSLMVAGSVTQRWVVVFPLFDTLTTDLGRNINVSPRRLGTLKESIS